MRLKTKYILLIGMLHLICLVLSFFVFKENKIIFLCAEALLIISIVISVALYRQLLQPLKYLSEGVHAIQDRDFSVKFVPTGRGEMDELIDVYNRMIDELRTERTKQQEQHFFLEKLIQTSPTGIIIMDFEQKIYSINPKATAIMELDGALVLSVIAELKTGSSKMLKIGSLNIFKIQKSNFIDRGFARIFVMLEEVTEEIFAAEKKAYGKVIRMMAHEVNNTVGPVNSILDLALNSGSLWSSGNYELLKNAFNIAVERNQNLNLFMRNFADLVKLEPANRQDVNLCKVLESVAEFMALPATDRQIDLALDLPRLPYAIFADVQQIEQALINIIKNAFEAISAVGIVKISLNPVSHILSISDTGTGLTEAHSAQLFNPFFSTKKDGQGIGLTLVREILMNHGYDFSLGKAENGLTTFEIQLR
ncbi:MAG: HAMP domain-containing protein [Pedobacter sp.]|nr:MAG: HAMP domain-containing protein [Pedobacter sp.]